MPSIVFAIDSLLGGGAEKVVLTLAEGFAKRGYKSHILTFSKGQDFQCPDAVKLWVIDGQSLESAGSRRCAKLAKLADTVLADIERESGPILGVISNLTFTDSIFHYSTFPRILYCVHNTLSDYWKINQGNFVKRFKRLRKLKRLYNGKNIVCVSRGAEIDLKALPVQPASIRTIYNPFDTDGIRARAQEYVDLGFEEDYLICVGRFKYQKRHDRLIRAFAKANLPVKLLLLGKGSSEQEQSLKTLVQELELNEKVIFLGFIANPYPYIRRAKALILSSDFEGLPTVIIESLICGTPVVSTDCPSGPREILIGDQAKFLVPPQDETLLAQKMQEVLTTPPNLDSLSLERFDWAIAVAQYEATLKSLG